MEVYLPKECIQNVIIFMNKYELMLYDTSQLNKNDRKLWLECLKNNKINIQGCKWTFQKNIIPTSIICKYQNLKYINTIYINKLSIYYSENKFTRINLDININIDNIKILYIDVGYKKNINNISGNNIETLFLINIYIDNNIFLNIKNTCPKLKNIIYINNKGTFKANIENNTENSIQQLINFNS